MLPSASLGDSRNGLYERPSTARRPTSAGKGIANPIGTILSAALLLRHRWARGARCASSAPSTAITEGARTADVAAR